MRAHCEHAFVETITGRCVEPWVNVLAAPESGQSMTRGRAYRCVHCRRTINLINRADQRMPEPPAPRHLGPQQVTHG